MNKNTFLTTPDIKKKLFQALDSGGLEMHKKNVFNHSRREKIKF